MEKADMVFRWNRGRGERPLQLADLLDHGKALSVLAFARGLFRAYYPAYAFGPVERVFGRVGDLYAGRFPGYRGCNTEYHDYCHVLEVFSTTARLLDGRNLKGGTEDSGEAALLLIAALLHDSGYIQADSDLKGTGAKYTAVHVDRSAAFVVAEAAPLGLSTEEAEKAARLILGTDMGPSWESIVYASEAERSRAAILAASDLLGQMGDRAYLEKLLFLYYEYREAGLGDYKTVFDILKKTLGFYEVVKMRLDGSLGSTVGFARAHFMARYGVDRDLYREAIERQMEYLRGIIEDDSSNFRKKLKRMDLEAAEREKA
jgi:hypothetical protein